MRIALVIPVHNEGQRIIDLIKNARQYVDQVIIVDDGSSDRTTQHICELNDSKIIVLRHWVNLGKGSALKTGCLAAAKMGIGTIVTMDGDGQHPPEHIPRLLATMERNNWQVVFSVREGGDKMPLVRYLGNYALNSVARYLFNLNLRDVWCGFRALRTECLPLINWRCTDYSGEIQMALKVGQSGLRYGEYVIPTVYEDEFKGVTIIHGLKLLVQMIIWRIRL